MKVFAIILCCILALYIVLSIADFVRKLVRKKKSKNAVNSDSSDVDKSNKEVAD